MLSAWLSPQYQPWHQREWNGSEGGKFLRACQSLLVIPGECSTGLLPQLGSAFPSYGNALTNVSLACGDQGGKTLWIRAWLHVLHQNPKVCMNFSTGEFGSAFILESLGFFGQKVWTQCCLVSAILSVFPNLPGNTVTHILWMWQEATFPPQNSVARMQLLSRLQAEIRTHRPLTLALASAMTAPTWAADSLAPSLGVCVW